MDNGRPYLVVTFFKTFVVDVATSCIEHGSECKSTSETTEPWIHEIKRSILLGLPRWSQVPLLLQWYSESGFFQNMIKNKAWYVYVSY